MPKEDVFHSLYHDTGTRLSEVTKNALEDIMYGFVIVTERQLKDFLPGGEYGKFPSDTTREQLRPCPLHNLEYAFGHSGL